MRVSKHNGSAVYQIRPLQSGVVLDEVRDGGQFFCGLRFG